ncbi:TM2 domain-containing protein [Polycladidibacter hongkongensis]|uniref:TM2 domain-containing protein n=1 Tax=Polycladidibacter hongkongensis TaxID=1647556 RepID=UPI000836EFB4|nr:TM2 domain-containing protein [Pseudovibrio hongkongensis]
MNKAAYFMQMKSIRDSVPEGRRDAFDMHFFDQERSPVVALVLGLLFGAFGVDRFYNGQILVGLLKLITAGGVGIWMIIDWFLIMGAVRVRNVERAYSIAAYVS